jgi:hypothetical protein
MTKALLSLALILASFSGLCVAQQNPMAEINRLEEEYNKAMQNLDVAWYESNLHESYTDIDAEGEVYTKAQEIADLRDMKAKGGEYQNVRLTDVRIRMFADTAVVVATLDYSYRAARDVVVEQRHRRLTEVLVRSNGRWQFVASQSTAIAK